MVHNDVVLTAAHCLQASQGNLEGRTIFVGGTTPSRDDAERFTITKVLRHPDFRSVMGAMYNDFMLLKLSGRSSARTAPVNSRRNSPADGSVVTAIGFGHTEQGGSGSTVLREVQVNVVNSDSCNDSYFGNLRANMHLCAAADGRDSCQNDSGGPLLQNGAIVGIVSFGTGCAAQGFPGVYARASEGYDFIQSGICQLSSNPPSSCRAADFLPQVPTLPELLNIPTSLYCPEISLGLFNFARDLYREAVCCPNANPRFFNNPFC